MEVVRVVDVEVLDRVFDISTIFDDSSWLLSSEVTHFR